MNTKITTLQDFIIQNIEDNTLVNDVDTIMNGIADAACVVSKEVNRAGLVDITGAYGTENVSGESQQKLDIFANDQFIKSLNRSGVVCGLASEENDDYVPFDAESAKYVVMIDPLDGSSNIDVNVSIGTIFGISRRISATGDVTIEDFFQTGNQQIGAGYVLYGSSTMLVFSFGNGVNGFTLDPETNVFCLSHPNMKIPETGKIYSTNEGNLALTEEGFKQYIQYCQEVDKDTNRPYSARYIGSLVADFHRNLLKGGLFMYPATKSAPNGKLRLLYECNPLSFIIEQAGGMATNGNKQILEILPEELHQRTPFFIGSTKMIEKVHGFLKEYAPV